MVPELIVGVLALAILAALVALRGVSGGRLEVKLSDAVIAVIPVILWLLLSGRVTKLVVGSEGITVETTRQAILQASAQPIKSQVPVARVATAEKGGFGEIPRLVKEGIEGLEFVLGRGIYAGPVIDEYLTRLTDYPFFRYVIYQDGNRRLVGMTDARKLTSFLRQNNAWNAFANAINGNRRAFIRDIPGYVPANVAIRADADKRNTLERMEKLNTEWLPVVDENKRFVGVVERSRLTASMILDVAKQLQGGE